MGRETKVSSTTPGRGIDYVRSAVYGASDGSLTSMSYGIRYSSYPYSYLATTRTLSAATGRMLSLTTHGLSLSYQYGVPGNPSVQTGHICDIVDQYAGDNSWHYEYDRWCRLTSAWVCNNRTDPYLRKWAFTYNQYGNITNVFKHFWAPTIPQGYDVPYSVNAGTNRLTTRTYDAAGNMTSMGAFDAENRLTSSGGVGYLYDGHGRRVRKLQNGVKTHYVYSHSGRLLLEANWGAETYRNQVYFGGQLVATHDQGNYVRFVFKDHLGSTRSVVRVDPNGTNRETDWETTEVYSYWPYGDVLSSMVVNEPVPTRDKYTGKPRDENRLDYFGARYYEPGDGLLYGNAGTLRWISADSLTAHIYDPPSLNCRLSPQPPPLQSVRSFWQG